MWVIFPCGEGVDLLRFVGTMFEKCRGLDAEGDLSEDVDVGPKTVEYSMLHMLI